MILGSEFVFLFVFKLLLLDWILMEWQRGEYLQDSVKGGQTKYETHLYILGNISDEDYVKYQYPDRILYPS